MTWLKKIKTETNDYLIDHPKQRQGLDWLWKFIVTLISCFIFAWGFRAFINPNETLAAHFVLQNSAEYGLVENTLDCATEYINEHGVVHFVSGGASGTSQAIIKFIEIFSDIREHEQLFISVFYFAINIPLIVLSWLKISKQFTIFTLINVGFVSLFQAIIPDSWIYNVVNIYDDVLARAIFGGITTGVSSGLAMMINTSAGGSDILSFFIAEKKSAAAGKFSFIINGCIILSYVIFGCIGHAVNPTVNPQENNETIRYLLYTLVYLFVSVHVLDLLNTKNKKQELQIFTSDENLSLVLIRAFPHSATIVDAKGAFTGKKRIVIYMVVSRSECKKAVHMARSVDPYSFIAVTDLNQVYGRFYTKPIE